MSHSLQMSAEQRTTYLASSVTGAPHVPTGNDAYVHVRVTEPIQPTGWTVAYLADGSGLTVHGRDLVLLEPASCVEAEVGADGQDPASDDHRADR